MSKLQEQIAKAKAQIEQTSKDVHEYVSDKNQPLDERWNLFIESGLGKDESFILHLFADQPKWKEWCRSAIEDSIFDHLSRGTVVKTVDLAEQLTEYIGHEFELDGATYETRDEKRKVTFTQEDYDDWRERMLEDFVKSFAFDW